MVKHILFFFPICISEKDNLIRREKALEEKYKTKLSETEMLSNQLNESEENFEDILVKYKTNINSIRKGISNKRFKH